MREVLYSKIRVRGWHFRYCMSIRVYPIALIHLLQDTEQIRARQNDQQLIHNQ